MTKKRDIIIGGGKGKFPLRYWLEIKSEENDSDKEKVMMIKFDDEEKITTTDKRVEVSIEIRLIDTNQPFLKAKPKEKEVIIVRKPGKTDIFVSDQKLGDKIAAKLNKMKGKWTPSIWCTDPKLITVSALKTISKNKITGKIVPLIEKIMEDSYGDEN